jgi:hypothetical protein
MQVMSIIRCLVNTVLLLAIISGQAGGQEFEPRIFELNQDFVQNNEKLTDPDACAPREVVSDLFRQIGSIVKVYPTENYYYFKFTRAGKSYSGSLRLFVEDRDSGILQFACYENYVSWLSQSSVEVVYASLDETDGLVLEKVGELEYRAIFEGNSVTFQLNDLDQTYDEDLLQSDEKFSGRIFDESGLIFVLIYNSSEKYFYYQLDTTNRVPEAFVRFSSEIYLGKRTGFLFYNDTIGNFILIGVQQEEVHSNSWYDGPFDQLPENFFNATTYWENVFDAFPELNGKLSSGGIFIDDVDAVFGIFAYRGVPVGDDFVFIEDCIKVSISRPILIKCLTGA